MTLTTQPKPYGLHHVVVASIDGLTSAPLPASTKFSFLERVTSAEGPGDDAIATVVSVLEAIDWALEATGLSLDAYAIIAGVSTTQHGTTPNQAKTLNRHGAVRFPYFQIYGEALGEGNDDVHCIIYKAKVTTGIQADMEYKKLQNTVIKGVGIDDGVNGVYDFVQHETAQALVVEGS